MPMLPSEETETKIIQPQQAETTYHSLHAQCYRATSLTRCIAEVVILFLNMRTIKISGEQNVNFSAVNVRAHCCLLHV